MIALLCALLPASAIAFVLPDTGITTCHDENGGVIVCPTSATEPYFGQDAQFGPGTMSFILGTGANLGTVSDQNTRLVWEQKSSADGQASTTDFRDADNVYGWDEAKTKLADLNASNYLGYSNWRLPTAEELDHLVDLSVEAPGPMIDSSFFSNTQRAGYWTDDVDIADSSQAWIIDFSTSLDQVAPKAEKHHVRLVRGSLQ